MLKFKIRRLNKKFFITILAIVLLFGVSLVSIYRFYAIFVEASDYHQGNSEVTSTTVYVNDLDKDRYYYMGLNYTLPSSSSVPSGTNRGLYSATNLVPVTVRYSADDYNDSNIIGKVSPFTGETATLFIYYKYYPIINGEIVIELPDNLFSFRPSDKAFGGWSTSYDGAKLEFDLETYTRYAHIPVSNSDPIDITFHAIWHRANTSIGTYINLIHMYNPLMKKAADFNFANPNNLDPTITYGYEFDPNVIYYERKTAAYYEQVTIDNSMENYIIRNDGGWRTGGFRCSRTECVYYKKTEDPEFYPNKTYYVYNAQVGNVLTVTNNQLAPCTYSLSNGYDYTGYFYKKDITDSNEGFYDETGLACSQSNICTSGRTYKLLNHNDPEAVYNTSTGNADKYYYLITRDVNILVINATQNITNFVSNKPFTLTASNRSGNGTGNINNNIYLTINNTSFNIGADLTIENVYINRSGGNSADEYSMTRNNNYRIVSMGHNLKIGRNVTNLSGANNKGIETVYGGGSRGIGTSTKPEKYKLIVESGVYNAIIGSSVNPNTSSNNTFNDYLNGRMILGSDYDRANNNNGAKLRVYYTTAAGFYGILNGPDDTTPAVQTIVKSGRFGKTRTNAYSSDYSYGIYVGGRGYVKINAYNTLKVEGGDINVINGGPGIDTAFQNKNVIKVDFCGGTVRSIFGGAGLTATHGNRIISVVGGTVQNNVFGGSNGSEADSNSDGTLYGSTLLYIGGTATIGGTNVTTLFGASSGDVFGAGAGKNGSNYTSVGTVDSTHVIVADSVKIYGNVYGGGNYGSTGKATNNASSTAKVDLLAGKVFGSVFGSSNNIGCGKQTRNAVTHKITINQNGTEVVNGIYGGSNDKGNVYAETEINLNSGSVGTAVFGGGKGQNTYLVGNSHVIISGINDDDLYVYGGSEQGGVGYSSEVNINTHPTAKVDLNSGKVGYIFGGSKGGTGYNPQVNSIVTVTINNGETKEAYGGNNETGTMNNSPTVDLNGGNVTVAAYGGSNKVGMNVSTVVNLDGGTATAIFGGSNQQGTTVLNYVNLISGTATNVYGGNNEGGVAQLANVIATGGDIGFIYGCGKGQNTSCNTTRVWLNGINDSDTWVFGGGESASVTKETSVLIDSGEVKKIFGGTNKIGSVPISNVYLSGGTVNEVYGGNNETGTTTRSYVKLGGATVSDLYGGGDATNTTYTNVYTYSGNATNVFGGGHNAGATVTRVDIYGGTITEVYGGSNENGTVGTSYVNIKDEGAVQAKSKNVSLKIRVALVNNLSINVRDYFSELSGKNVTWSLSNNSVGNMNGNNLRVNNAGEVEVSTTYEDKTYKLIVDVNNSDDLQGITNHSVNHNNVYYFYSENLYSIPSYTANSASITNVYGGNNSDGTTLDTNVELFSSTATVNTVYGGGNYAESDYTNVYLEAGTLETLYGGGNGEDAIVNHESKTVITGGVVNTSTYGGGNAAQVVEKSEITLLDGVIHGSLFAAGNQAVTGDSGTNSAETVVNVLAGTIDKNVYGGANTSVVYGETYVYIGKNARNFSEYDGYTIGDRIDIGSSTMDAFGKVTVYGGTIFGGGEANDSGSTEYDYNFISVTTGTNVVVDGEGYYENGNRNMNIYGSFFGSGNASETSGYSKVTIRNYGTEEIPAKNISLQRASEFKMVNSYIELSGTTDRTNDWDTTYFSISRLKHFYMLDNSDLYLQNGANLLENIYSGLYENNQFVKEAVDIDETGTIISRNVDNRIFIVQTEVLNIAEDQNAKVYGDVHGMAYFGMYKPNIDGTVNQGLYSYDYSTSDVVDDIDITIFTGGTYVLGEHYHDPNDDTISTHDIKVDGYFSHFVDDETNVLKIDYITPTPEEGKSYTWAIGVDIANFEFDMVASKFSTLGTAELTLNNFGDPNTTFNITGFNYDGLAEGVNFINKNNVPKVAATDEDADSNYAFGMSTSNVGWSNKATTNFYTGISEPIQGDKWYYAENSLTVPSLQFFLYHSKNIATDGVIGTVYISMMARIPVTGLADRLKRINITVNITRTVIDTVAYDASIAPGKLYSVFPLTKTNITNKSSMSAYFSLFAQPDNNRTLYETGDYRAIATNQVWPVGTTITMLDMVENEYYYYTVDATNIVAKQTELQTQHEVSYYLRDFMKMDSTSTNNTYDDEAMNSVYYHSSENYVDEEFIFIVDFANTEMVDSIIDAPLILNIRNADDQTKTTVFSGKQREMVYGVYANTSTGINSTASLTKDLIYIGEKTTLLINSSYQAGNIPGSSEPVVDTQYYDYKLGAKISIYDSRGNMLDGSSLMGVTFTLNEKNYYPQLSTGITRIPLADRVSNVNSSITIDTANSSLIKGDYTIVVETFGSYDGLYYGETPTTKNTLSLSVLNNLFGLEVTSEDVSVTRDKITGLDANGSDEIDYYIEASSGLDTPNLRVHLERREYGTGKEYSMNYNRVDLQDYVTDNLGTMANAERLEYVVDEDLPEEIIYSIHIGENNITGTYRLVFTVCDGDVPIGSVYQYIIIR